MAFFKRVVSITADTRMSYGDGISFRQGGLSNFDVALATGLDLQCLGDIVGLYGSMKLNEQVASGVVILVTSTSLEVSFDLDINLEENNLQASCRVVKLANDVTHKRLKKALNGLKEDNSFLTRCLFGLSQLSPPLQSLSSKIQTEDGVLKFINGSLDESQREAVRFALLQKELAIIHGPPGTGKTTTIVEIISQMVKSGCKVLCCAPSNVAVDNLLERLVKNKMKVVRLGHPARINPELQKHSLDAIISFSDQAQIVQDVRKDIDNALKKLKKTRNKGERGGIAKDLKYFRKELNDREKTIMKDVLKGADVVLATLTSASPDGPLRNLPKDHFDVTVIDECSQALELACWIVVSYAKKLILSGDHKQLPPTILSHEAAGKGLDITLMERLIRNVQSDLPMVKLLSVQYRMHQNIMKWSSQTFYENQLLADNSVKHHLLKDLKSISETEDTVIPILTIDTTGCDMYEMETLDEISKANEGEVGLVCIHVDVLVKSGMDPKDIAIISPYNLQVELLRLQLREKYPALEIKSVDGFQGREKEAVILSLVRSNEKHEVGFLAESRRLNVAVTRARRHVAIVCNLDTIRHGDLTLKSFAEYLENFGEVRSAVLYQHDLDVQILNRPEGMELRIIDEQENVEKKKLMKQKKSVGRMEVRKKQQIVKENVAPTPAAADIRVSKTCEEKQDEEESVRQKFSSEIEAFISSEQEEMSFSSKLNSHDRLVIHEISEAFGLFHESLGEGKNRFIQIRKRKDLQKPDNHLSEGVEKLALIEGKSETDDDDDATVTCSTCEKSVPKLNMDLHVLRCRQKPIADAQSNPKDQKKRPKKAKVKLSRVKEEDKSDNFDAILESFTRQDRVCNGAKCKEKVTNVNMTCSFCLLRFCFNHGMPEAHGCGDAARLHARKAIGQDKRLYPGSGRPETKLNPVKQKQLKAKLDKKINSMSEERKVKKKS